MTSGRAAGHRTPGRATVDPCASRSPPLPPCSCCRAARPSTPPPAAPRRSTAPPGRPYPSPPPLRRLRPPRPRHSRVGGKSCRGSDRHRLLRSAHGSGGVRAVRRTGREGSCRPRGGPVRPTPARPPRPPRAIRSGGCRARPVYRPGAACARCAGPPGTLPRAWRGCAAGSPSSTGPVRGIGPPGALRQPERMADLRPWIYGTDHDNPNPRTPAPGHVSCDRSAPHLTDSSSTSSASVPTTGPRASC